MFRFGVVVLTAFVFIYIGIHLAGGRYLALASDVALLGATWAIAVYARRTGRYLVAQNLVHISLFLTVLFQAYITGIYGGALWWLSVLPFLAVVAGARVLAVVQFAVFAVVALSFNSLATIQPIEAPAAATATQLIASSAVLCTLYTMAFMLQGLRWRDKLEQALSKARAEALDAAAMKARFLATMSHEIRTPLNGVVGSAELLQKADLSPGERAQMMSLLTQSSKALLAFINDILDWSKLDVGKIAIEQQPINLRALVFESNELFAGQAANKGIELTSSCNPDVARVLEGDPTRIRQIVNNLVSNAVKFTQHGGVHIHLSIDGIDPSDKLPDGAPRMARVEVSDSGIGMPAGKLGSLFQAFEQGDASVTRQYGGTGLGLAISQELAKLMGGRIEVSSVEGVGSTFTLLVPMRVIEAAAPSRLPRQRTDVVLATASQGLRRHLRTILYDFRVDPAHVNGFPSEPELSNCRLLLIDAPLLESVDDLAAWLDAHAAAGRRVAVITPLNRDAVVGALPEAMLLYKPVRRSSVRALLEAADFTQPRVEPACPDPVAAAPSATSLRGLRVLIAEDNQVNQVVFQAMLAQAEVSCSIAGDGQEALDMLAAETFDVVLMDVQMPVLDGLSAVRTLRAREQSSGNPVRVTVIAMTANTEPQDIAQCRAAGMDDFLPKPFGMGQITSVLERYAHRATTAAG